MRQTAPDSPIGDISYLARSAHRVPTLVALTNHPRSRSELCELAGVSSSTIRRTLREFEDRSWIRREGYQYVATRLGEAIAIGMEDLIERVETERKLRDVWHWLPEEISECSVETWSELNITVSEPDAPYRPVDRFESLLQQTSTLRFLHPEVALMDPCFDTLYGLIKDGVDTTLIDRPECHTYFRSTYSERSSELLQRENFEILEHDDLPPYGLGLLDDRVLISCYEQESGAVRAVVDTNVPKVRTWGNSVYTSYKSDAWPFEPHQVVE